MEFHLIIKCMSVSNKDVKYISEQTIYLQI